MDYCGPIGIPHSQFLKWSAEDQDKAIAWKLLQGETCQMCGTLPEDWIDDEGYPIDPPPYRVATRACLGCQAIDSERAKIRESLPDNNSHIYPYLQRMPRR